MFGVYKLPTLSDFNMEIGRLILIREKHQLRRKKSDQIDAHIDTHWKVDI